MKETIKKVKEYSIICPICKRPISGYSPSQVTYNMGLHKEAHKRLEVQK